MQPLSSVSFVFQFTGTSVYGYYRAPEVIFTIQFYSMAVIISLGIVANFLSVLVFVTSCMRHSSTGHYLLALACADLSVMIAELLTWLNTLTHTQGIGHKLNINFYDTYNVFCKGLSWLRYASRLVSAWLVVAITAERCAAIVRPLDVSRISTPKRAKKVITTVTLISIIVSSYPLYTVAIFVEGSDSFCYVSKVELYDAMTWIVLRIGDLILPSLVICTLTSAIAYRLIRQTSNRRQLDRATGSGVIMRGTPEQKINTMLLCIALTFVFIRLPRTILYYLHFHRDSPSIRTWDQRSLHAAYLLSQPLYTINYAINFFFYCFLGTAFRIELMLFLRRFCHRKYAGRLATEFGSMSIQDCELVRVGDRYQRGRTYKNSDPSLNKTLV